MPAIVLVKLAFVAGFFALYSATCFLKMPENWQPFLKTIAVVNLAYSCLTIGLVMHFYERLTMIGLVYFVAELVIVITLASIELKVALQK